jgi:hypothetical protein
MDIDLFGCLLRYHVAVAVRTPSSLPTDFNPPRCCEKAKPPYKVYSAAHHVHRDGDPADLVVIE